jgi:hypothetical protein
LSLALGGCQSDKTAPFTGDCSGDPVLCNPHPGGVGGGQRGDAGFDAALVDGGPLGTLTGNVLVLSDDLVTSATYPSPATVQADGATIATVTAPWDGTTPYLLTDVKQEVQNWVGAKPANTADDPQWTFLPVPTDSATSQNLFLVRGSTLDAIFDVLTARPTRNTALAQIVVSFFSVSTQAPISGLTASLPQAEVVAYANAASWTDVPGSITDNTGTLVFANVSTGIPAIITLGGTRSGTASVQVVAGAVSLASFSLTP